ncbi:MAG: hypothetical protein R6U55_05840 [Desulfovermiculus sp.]
MADMASIFAICLEMAAMVRKRRFRERCFSLFCLVYSGCSSRYAFQ